MIVWRQCFGLYGSDSSHCSGVSLGAALLIVTWRPEGKGGVREGSRGGGRIVRREGRPGRGRVGRAGCVGVRQGGLLGKAGE